MCLSPLIAKSELASYQIPLQYLVFISLFATKLYCADCPLSDRFLLLVSVLVFRLTPRLHKIFNIFSLVIIFTHFSREGVKETK